MENMPDSRTKVWRILLMGLIFYTSTAHSEEIKAIGWLGLEGELSVDYAMDKNKTINDNTQLASSDEQYSILQERLYLEAHTYVYHPNFLTMDIGGGPVFFQNSIRYISTTTPEAPELKETGNVFDYNIRMSFLKRKAVPFSLYYARTNPINIPTISETIAQKNTRYGFNLLWRAPITFSLDSTYFDTKGQGLETIIDDVSESTTIRAYKSFKEKGNAQLYIIHQVQDSKSGSRTGTAIVPNVRTTDSANFDTRLTFGTDNKLDLDINTKYETLDDNNPYDTISSYQDLRWTHSKKLQSTYSYSYYQQKFANNKSINHQAKALLSYRQSSGISSSGWVSANYDDLEQSKFNSYTTQGDISYNQRFDGGYFGITGLAGFSNYDSKTKAGGNGIERVDLERGNITDIVNGYTLNNKNVLCNTNTPANPLPGTTPPTYQQPGCNSDTRNGSIGVNAIVVNRADGNRQVLIEGVDYKLDNLKGDQTRILRLATNGTPVSAIEVSYSYEQGGDYKYKSVTTGISTTLDFLSYFSLNADYSDYALDVTEGSPGIELTDRTVTSYGATVDFPLLDNLMIGYETKFTKTVESISPSDQEFHTYYMQLNLFRSVSLYLSRNDNIVEYSLSAEDTDAILYNAVLTIIPTRRTKLNLSYRNEEDTGGTIPRKLSEANFDFEWHYRKIGITASVTNTKESTNSETRDRTTVNFNIVRKF